MDLFSKLKKMKILLIDDDELIRNSLALFFEEEGCHLLAVETAEEGIEVLKKQSCDIIFADYRLPGINGLEFFKRIKAIYPRSMKILITAYKDEKVVSEAIKVGIQDFIEKPFTIETIEQSISRVIKETEH